MNHAQNLFDHPGSSNTVSASRGVIDNKPQSGALSDQSYSIRANAVRPDHGDIVLILAFSGGGTRASALAYGVMEGLRDTVVTIGGEQFRVLDGVEAISSVSGGSFTSAYYGLYGDRLFEDFEKDFLRRNVERSLILGMLNPLEWFSPSGRTEMAVRFYDKILFDGATFADLGRKGGPLLLINASDLGYGVRFSFIQEYFNLLCSDIGSFPVVRAVTASSAVPVLFEPVVLENYQECKSTKPEWLVKAEQRAVGHPLLEQAVDGLHSYYKRDKRHYAHFVDGGITDNLGLRAITEVTEVSGGIAALLKKIDRVPPPALRGHLCRCLHGAGPRHGQK
ncbi:MAG: patatin-like phospholipase family protein [Gammaproteobacteria bacterium]|nr:patatin-like phospholipase family protein [Gammaproteobacteria bacterium]